jgi:hypothetical protein
MDYPTTGSVAVFISNAGDGKVVFYGTLPWSDCEIGMMIANANVPGDGTYGQGGMVTIDPIWGSTGDIP